MSPASQGNLEVERYIGSNLISSCARINNAKSKKGRKSDGKPVLLRADINQSAGETAQRHGGSRQNFHIPSMLPSCGCNGNFGYPSRPGQFGASGWTGMPLISVAGDGKKKSQNYQDPSRSPAADDDSTLRTPLSRLAIHTQGAPLILSGRCYNGRKNQIKGNPIRSPRGDLVVRRSNKYKDNHSHVHGGTSDCLSVASDESSGSGHSENCLPRIIKPRKRRKKDRKPSIPSAENFGGEEATAIALETAAAPCTKPTETEDIAGKKAFQKCDIKPNTPVPGLLTSNGSQLDEASEDEGCGPKLHHTFEDVTESESPSYGCLPSSCQCHYCDPSGIWDAPSNFFSGRGKNASSYLTPPPDSTRTFHYFSPHSDLALRRSWSEPMPDLQGSGKDPDRASQQLPPRSNSFTDSKTSKTRNSVSGCGDVTKSSPKKSDQEVKSGYGRQCLEVSTEIVTSPNGHRDIEIRFYSTSPPA